jgi:hypothetical protein
VKCGKEKRQDRPGSDPRFGLGAPLARLGLPITITVLQNFLTYRIPNDNKIHNPMAPDADKKKDPRAWDALTPPLAEWILDAISAMGFGRMTPVQASTIPLFSKNKDVVVEVLILDAIAGAVTDKLRLLLGVGRP